MPILRNIAKLVAPNYGKGTNDTIDYINSAPWSAAADVSIIKLNQEFGSHTGSNGSATGSYLFSTINTTDLIIPGTSAFAPFAGDVFSTWPTSGYVLIGTEVIGYTSVNPQSSSASGLDELVVPSTAYRGMWGTSADTHIGGATTLITEILFGVVSNIEYNTDDKSFNIWTNVTQGVGPAQSYGADMTNTVSSYLFPLTEENVTFYEYSAVTA